LTGSDIEFGLDLLDSGFEFEMIEFSVVRNAISVEDFSRLSMLAPRPAVIVAEKAMHIILAYTDRGAAIGRSMSTWREHQTNHKAERTDFQFG
jgi:hypothetical protein